MTAENEISPTGKFASSSMARTLLAIAKLTPVYFAILSLSDGCTPLKPEKNLGMQQRDGEDDDGGSGATGAAAIGGMLDAEPPPQPTHARRGGTGRAGEAGDSGRSGDLNPGPPQGGMPPRAGDGGVKDGSGVCRLDVTTIEQCVLE
jgi:hypothetical protein